MIIPPQSDASPLRGADEPVDQLDVLEPVGRHHPVDRSSERRAHLHVAGGSIRSEPGRVIPHGTPMLWRAFSMAAVSPFRMRVMISDDVPFLPSTFSSLLDE